MRWVCGRGFIGAKGYPILNFWVICKIHRSWIFPVGKESACRARDTGDADLPPEWGRSPEERNGSHSSVLAWKSCGWMSPAGYSPQGRKEVDTTEWLHSLGHRSCINLHPHNQCTKFFFFFFVTAHLRMSLKCLICAIGILFWFYFLNLLFRLTIFPLWVNCHTFSWLPFWTIQIFFFTLEIIHILRK